MSLEEDFPDYKIKHLNNKEINMVLNSFKEFDYGNDGPPWPEDEDEEVQKRMTMKNIFINSKLKKLKFSAEIVDKLKFGNIKELMKIEDGFEGYFGAYSEIEFLSYRFQKIHDVYPDTLRMQYVNSEKFLTELYKFVKVPPNSFQKSIEDNRGKIFLNSIIFAFETLNPEIQMYLYMDRSEATIIYDKNLEKDEKSILNTLIALLKGCVIPSVTKNKIFVVYQTQHGFEKTGFDVKKIKVDLEENYNEGFVEVSEEIVTGLNDRKKSNLVILSGAPGTGKCVIGKTKITVRNKKTGIIEELYIEDLM